MAELLDEEKVSLELASIPEWKREGIEIVREFKFSSYLEGIAFVGRVAELAEAANHHPDMLVSWRKVSVRFSTHSAGGLTKLDFKLAKQLNGLTS